MPTPLLFRLRTALTFVVTGAFAFSSLPAIALVQRSSEPSPDQMIQQYSNPIPGVDWDELSPHFVEMLDRIFERNNWNDESDEFAKKVALRIAEIPPWDMNGRFGALSEEVSQRYGLTPQQKAGFQRAVLRESASMLLRHGPQMWEQAHDALQTRSQGKPYTADQIARWAKDSEPLFQEIESSANRIAEEVGRNLPDDKKRILESDMTGFHRRQKVVEEMNHRWAQGRWQPSEWGLENDPIQTGGRRPQEPTAQKTAEAAATPPRPAAPLIAPVVLGAPIPDMWVDHDPATWIALVIEIAKRYGLDAGQMDTAWSIHSELVQRAARFKDLRATELEAVPVARRSEHAAYGPIRELFGELRSRLESVSHSAQREASR